MFSNNPGIKTFIFITLLVFSIEIPHAQALDSMHSTNFDVKANEENVNEDKIDEDTDDIETEDIETNNESENEVSGEDESTTIGLTHKYLSESVLGVTNKLDYFWGDDRSIEEANRTSIRIRMDFDLDQGSGFDFIPDIKANIRLPRTKNKLHLFINGEEGDEDDLESDINNDDESGTFFLRYFFYKSPWYSLAADTGIRIRSSSVAWFSGIRGRIYLTYGKWGFRVTDKLRWFTDRKLTNWTRLDIERVIFKNKSFFRASTLGRWFQHRDGYFVEQNFQYFHRLAKKTGVVLQWKTLGETRLDDFFKETRVRLRFRQNVKWKWLFAEIGPSVFWDEENNWDTKLGIRFRIEAHFGNISKLKFF